MACPIRVDGHLVIGDKGPLPPLLPKAEHMAVVFLRRIDGKSYSSFVLYRLLPVGYEPTHCISGVFLTLVRLVLTVGYWEEGRPAYEDEEPSSDRVRLIGVAVPPGWSGLSRHPDRAHRTLYARAGRCWASWTGSDTAASLALTSFALIRARVGGPLFFPRRISTRG
jgi:hypothetical protein